MNNSALIGKSVVAVCLTTLVSLSGHLAADDSDARHGLKSNPCAGRSLAIKGEFETTIQILPPFPSFPREPFQPILYLLISAKGKLSHFGPTTAATTDQAVDLFVNPSLSLFKSLGLALGWAALVLTTYSISTADIRVNAGTTFDLSHMSDPRGINQRKK